MHNWHNVNIAQGFREPGVYYLQAQGREIPRAPPSAITRRSWASTASSPAAALPATRTAGPATTDPRQGFETCGIVEFMHSFEMLTKISGNPLWADRCEEIAFNSLPAALTPD